MQASAFEQARERFAQGVIATEQKNYPEAIQIFNALIKDFPNLPEPYNNLAVLYASQGEDFAAAARQAAMETRDTLNRAAALCD